MKITVPPTALGTEGEGQVPACHQRGCEGGMLGGNSSTFIKFLVKRALEEKAALDVSPTNRREKKQDFEITWNFSKFSKFNSN